MHLLQHPPALGERSQPSSRNRVQLSGCKSSMKGTLSSCPVDDWREGPVAGVCLSFVSKSLLPYESCWEQNTTPTLEVAGASFSCFPGREGSLGT